MGIGFAPAVLALFLYSLLPLVRNTYEGIKGVDRNYVEASKGIGLTSTQILFKVEIPLALPIILAGLRTATVIVIGTATLAALIGAGGLGDPIFRGVATVNSNLILLGAIPSALLAIAADKFIGWSETHLVSKGIRLKNKR
jgi:osmoprotectant transport system permease protein